MAKLSLTVGPITATVEASDSRATAVLDTYADAINASGTNQERAEAVLQSLMRHLVDTARNHRHRTIILQAQAEAEAQCDDLDWTQDAEPPAAP